MGYKLKSITVENFVVFKDRTTVDFSYNQLNLIEGIYHNNPSQSNGAGKSFIIDAVCLALFGKGVRANYLSDYLPFSNPTGGIYIGLELIDENNTNVKIERWKRPNSDTNKAKLWKNGVCISQDSTITKIDEAIQSIIGINHTNFLSCIFSVMLPGFLRLRPAQRFEILEHALAVKRIESVIKKINASIKSNEDAISAIHSVITEKNNKYISEKTKKEIYCSNIDSIKENITEHEAELVDYQGQEKSISDKIKETQQFLKECNIQLAPLDIEYNELVAERRAKEVNKDNLKLKKTAVLKSFKKNGQGSLECSVCKSSLTEHSKESVKEHYDAEIVKIENEILALSAIIIEKNNKVNKVTKIKEQTEKAYNKLVASLSFVQTNMMALEKALINNRASLETASSSFNEALLNSLNKELKELRDSLKNTEKQLTINIAWKQVMSKNGLRLSYIKEEVSTLNALASRYATAICETPTQVRFFINDEKDNPSLDFTVNGQNSGMASTGERGRLEIAMTLSLLSLLKTAGLSLDFLILDEALDGLSQASKQAVLNVIDSLSLDYQVLMISHDDLIKNRPGYVIQVMKDASTERSTISTYTRKSQPE